MGIVIVSGLVLADAILSIRVMGRWQTPLSHWAATVSDHPRSAGAHARFALLLVQQAALEGAPADDPRSARAEQEINSALELNPRLPEAWEARGMWALRRGDCATAVASLKEALARRPGDAEINKLLGACH
jgi:Tfp pilus assembly protein PilF